MRPLMCGVTPDWERYLKASIALESSDEDRVLQVFASQLDCPSSILLLLLCHSWIAVEL
jgi:hypothetical protein